MAERNYPCDSHIKAYFGERDLDSVGVEAFQRQLYYCTVATTLWLKGAIEEIRSSNTFGTLVSLNVCVILQFVCSWTCREGVATQ